MWIDTHCHLDAREFGGDSLGVAARAAERGVGMIVIPAIDRNNWPAVRDLAASAANASYAIGIHPICVPRATEDDLVAMRDAVRAALDDPNFVAIGEVGLDFFLPELCEPAMRDKQILFFREQLKIAREFGLPVLTHVRKSQDQVLKHVRQIPPAGGIAHAFNGSFQQAQGYIDVGFKLGFGGNVTFTRALQIRRLAEQLPLDSIVMETDAPDIAPHWLHPGVNTPDQVPAIADVLAQLRGIPLDELQRATTANAHIVMPRLRALTGT
ncbi:TatD DNase family protein [Pseudoduganella flava]|uniref:TatD DNase family protein n=1 Tax=Pseudoduganella flava TaxID=871742 RepID=A0A562PHX4_9BURK|nr:TatD family hydrolase [Pseudoduganella flava]QGZ42830.1 TatD family deoxyribonuclease [Pseudoduganella flava]TWI44065.1 TatD DNase family protein [Pseudoduganella flava]